MEINNKFEKYSETARNFVFYFGCENQRNKAIEELSELIRAIAKNDKTNIIEEIGDVLFLIEQIMDIYNISEEKIIEVFDKKHDKMLELFKPKK